MWLTLVVLEIIEPWGICLDYVIDNFPKLLAVDGLVVEVLILTLFYLYFGGDCYKYGPVASEAVLPFIL